MPTLTQQERDSLYCEAILEWASTNDNFDPSFVEKMYEILEGGGHLSLKQSAAIVNIIHKWNVDCDA